MAKRQIWEKKPARARKCAGCGKAMRRLPICGHLPDSEVKALSERHGGVIWLGCMEVGFAADWGWHCPTCGKTEYQSHGEKWNEYTDGIIP